MRKSILLGIVILLVIGGGTAGIAYSTWEGGSEDAPAVTSVRGSADVTPGGLNVDDSNNSSGNLQQNLDSQSSGLPNGSASSQPVVDPAKFSEYEKHKDGTEALFGDIVVGSGAEAANGKRVAIIYKGWLTNGTLFDESKLTEEGKLQALSFQIGAREVIAGMDQGVLGMKVGGKRLIIVPPKVGYGSQKMSTIPPGSVLIFQVELAAVE